MTFNPKIWYPIAVLLGLLNLAGMGYALGVGEGSHAAAHVGLMLGSWAWARRLRERRDETREDARVEAGDGNERLEDLEAEMESLRRQLGDTQERLDFAERMLAQRPEPRRVDPQR
jgi:hypothetical protein